MNWQTRKVGLFKRRVYAFLLITTLSGALLITFSSSAPDDQNDYLSELTKAYNTLSFYGNHQSLYTLNEIASDELVIPQRGGDWFDGGTNLRLHQHTYTPNEAALNNVWQNIYTGINTCNQQLYQYSRITTAGKEIYVAELRVLRAYYHYLLLDLFGKAPILDNYFPASPGLPTSNTAAQLYSFVESEILASLPDLSNAPMYGRFNQSAANAVLAKLYLNANTYIATAKWTEASDACDEIIGSGHYNLESNYFSNFVHNNEASPETILQIPYDEMTLKGFNIGQMTLHTASQATFNLQQQPWNGYSTIEDFYNSFESTDVRKGQFLTGIQRDTTNHIDLVDPAFEVADPDGAVLNFTPAINELAPNALRQAGARVFKWKYQLGAGPDLNNDFAIFRYADVLLMKAEAQLNLGDPVTALSLVNQIRTRAGLATWGGLTAADLLEERGREFFAETWRRQDLIRFGVYNNAWWEKASSPSFVRIFPIPLPQILANPNLSQNPGY